jgi:hypothetical protein
MLEFAFGCFVGIMAGIVGVAVLHIRECRECLAHKLGEEEENESRQQR